MHANAALLVKYCFVSPMTKCIKQLRFWTKISTDNIFKFYSFSKAAIDFSLFLRTDCRK